MVIIVPRLDWRLTRGLSSRLGSLWLWLGFLVVVVVPSLDRRFARTLGLRGAVRLLLVVVVVTSLEGRRMVLFWRLRVVVMLLGDFPCLGGGGEAVYGDAGGESELVR